MTQPPRPIVVKRGPRRRTTRHGGAWKLAYADFMTAMMAFFLLMWLLGSVNSSALTGIADYFKTPLKAALLGGPRTHDGSSILQGGGTAARRTDPRDGQPAAAPVIVGAVPTAATKVSVLPDTGAAADTDAADDERLRQLKRKLDAALASNPTLHAYRGQIILDIAREGLRVQIVDTQNRPMFANASATVEPYMRDILREIGRTLNGVPNHVMLSGHTDAHPYAGGEGGYSNWELSADRANASRRELVSGGMDEDKIVRVVGLASTEKLVGDDPLAPANRRITVVVLTRRAEQAMQRNQEQAPSLGVDDAAHSDLMTSRLAPPP